MLSLPVLTHPRSAADPLGRPSQPSFPCPASLHHDRVRRLACLAALAAFAAAFFLLVPTGRADIQGTKQRGKIPGRLLRNAPASPVPSSEEIDPGEQVEITMEAHGGGGRTIEFDFATQPRHGVLAGFHVISRNKAVVTYMHDPASGPGHDQFTYRVQASGMQMSGPVAVDIEVRDYPPKIALSPEELDFGAVKVGEIAHAQVTVRNGGGGVATGRVEPPNPWTVDGSADFRLAAGEKQTFRLVFKPGSGRSFAETMRVGDYGSANQHPANLRLIGTGLGAQEPQFAGINGVPPVPLEAAAEPINPARTAQPAAGTPVTPAPAPSPALAGAPGQGADKAVNSGAPDAATGGGGQSGPGFEPPPVVLNEAGVKALQEHWHERTSLEIGWVEPKPAPAKYRVELRYLSLDKDDNLRVDWQPYARVEITKKNNAASAVLRGLPAGTNPAVRVVAVDQAGRFAAASPMAQVQLDPELRWWRLSLLQWLLIALAICAFLVIRQRRENQQILDQIDMDRRAREKAQA